MSNRFLYPREFFIIEKVPAVVIGGEGFFLIENVFVVFNTPSGKLVGHPHIEDRFVLIG